MALPNLLVLLRRLLVDLMLFDRETLSASSGRERTETRSECLVSRRFKPEPLLLRDSAVDLVSSVVCVTVLSDIIDSVSDPSVLSDLSEAIVDNSCSPLVGGGGRRKIAGVMYGPSVLLLTSVDTYEDSGDGDRARVPIERRRGLYLASSSSSSI